MKREKPDLKLVEEWLHARCSVHPEASNPARGLYLAWQDWVAARSAEEVLIGTPRSFSNALKNLGFPWHREGGKTRIHTGLRARLPSIPPHVDRDVRGFSLTCYANRYWC